VSRAAAGGGVRLFQILFAAAIVAVCGALNDDLLDEAYGAGPPFYGRTVNMDRWEDPLPQLLLVNALGVAGLVGLVMSYRRTSTGHEPLDAEKPRMD
jgi:hypothetical protein